ncbi:hypothetical protein [Actinomadura sp. GTD37]|uniref:hypothetical protein n=1 Tax=Actinomadura sp. GTD37 TaxID=1778030 RepID=UPI0035C23FE6
MATRAAIAGVGAAALAALGLAAGFARAQTSDPPDLGDVVRVSPPPATRSPASRSPASPSPAPRPAATRTPRQGGRPVTPPRPPGSDDDGEIDDDADDD